jgi:hypothetical protein
MIRHAFFFLSKNCQETGKARKRGVLGSEMLLVSLRQRRRLSLLLQQFCYFFIFFCWIWGMVTTTALIACVRIGILVPEMGSGTAKIVV